MWRDLSDNDLIDAAERRSTRGVPLPVDLIEELLSRGLDPAPYL